MKQRKSSERARVLLTDLVTVAKFGNSMEAQLASTKLQSRKIKSYVFDENMICLNPAYDLALGGVRLQVEEKDLDQASKILGEKSGGNFWAPRKMFLFTYVFSPYIVGVLLVPIGILAYLLRGFIVGSIDMSFFMCLNAILFGIISFAYSERVAKTNTKWMADWSGTQIQVNMFIKSLRYLGIFVFGIGIILTYNNSFWFSIPTLFWCLLSLAIWMFFFIFISNPKFAALMKRLNAWSKNFPFKLREKL